MSFNYRSEVMFNASDDAYNKSIGSDSIGFMKNTQCCKK